MDIQTLQAIKKLVSDQLDKMEPRHGEPNYCHAEAQAIFNILGIIDYEIFREDKEMSEYYEKMDAGGLDEIHREGAGEANKRVPRSDI